MFLNLCACLGRRRSGVKVEHDFQLKALLYKEICFLEITWYFQHVIMVQPGVSGQILGSSNEAILQTQSWKNQLLVVTLDHQYYYFSCTNLTHKLWTFSASKLSWSLLGGRNMGRCTGYH